MEVYVYVLLIWIEVLFDYHDEEGLRPFGSSSHLAKLKLDSFGKPIGFSREFLVFSHSFVKE